MIDIPQTLAVVNNPNVPFGIGNEWPSWAITHFIPLYDPDIDISIHNNQFPGKTGDTKPADEMWPTTSATSFYSVITSNLDFSNIRGQRLYNLQPQEIDDGSGTLKKMIPVWKYYNSDGRYYGQNSASGNSQRLGSLYIPAENGTEYSNNIISGLNQPAMTPYNVVEWYLEDTSAYVMTTIPGLEPLKLAPDNITPYITLSESDSIVDINYGTSSMSVTHATLVDSFDDYAVIIDATGNLSTQDKREIAFSSISYVGSVANTESTDYEKNSTIQGQFDFLVRPQRGNFRFNKILFFCSNATEEMYQYAQSLQNPQFFGHLGFTNAETVGRTNESGRTLTGIVDHVNILAQVSFSSNVETTPVTVINVNDWQKSVTSSVAFPGVGSIPDQVGSRFQTVYPVGMSPYFYYEPMPDATDNTVLVPMQEFHRSSRAYEEDVSNHYAAQSYAGDIAIGQINSINGNNIYANGGLPSMMTPRAKLHIAQTSRSYGKYDAVKNVANYVYVNTYFPHLRLSDKTFMAGMDFRFMDVMYEGEDDWEMCIDPYVDNYNGKKIKLPHKGILTIGASCGYQGGMGIAIGENAIADAEVIAGDIEDGKVEKVRMWALPAYRANNFALAYGLGSKVFRGANSVAIGEYAQVYRPNSYAIGRRAVVVDTDHGYAIGPSAITSTVLVPQFVQMYNNNLGSILHAKQQEMLHGSFTFGQETLSDNGLAMGYYSKALGRIITVSSNEIVQPSANPDEMDCVHGHTCNCCACIRANYLLLSRNLDASAISGYEPDLTETNRDKYSEYYALAIGLNAVAISRGVAIGINVKAFFHDAWALGTESFVRSRESLALGFFNEIGSYSTVNKLTAHIVAIGYSQKAYLGADIPSTPAGEISTLNGFTAMRDILLGFNNTMQSAINCIGIGQNHVFDTRMGAIAIGRSHHASNVVNNYSIAIGNNVVARGLRDVSMGYTIAMPSFASDSVTIGANLSNYGYSSVCIGRDIRLDAPNGNLPSSNGFFAQSVFIGSAFGYSDYRIAGINGYASESTNGRIISIGSDQRNDRNTIAIGNHNSAYGYQSIILGITNYVVKDEHINGTDVSAPDVLNMRNILIGTDNRMSGMQGISIGRGNRTRGISVYEKIGIAGINIGIDNILVHTKIAWAELSANSPIDDVKYFINDRENYLKDYTAGQKILTDIRFPIAIGEGLDTRYTNIALGYFNRGATDLYNTEGTNPDRNIDSMLVIGNGEGTENRSNLLEIGSMIFSGNGNKINKTLIIIGNDEQSGLPDFSNFNFSTLPDTLPPRSLFVGKDGLVRYYDGIKENVNNIIGPIKIYENQNCAGWN